MEHAVKLQAVRFYEGEQRADVYVLDGDTPRLIKYTWMTRDLVPVLPDTWWSAVLGEVELQHSQEAAAAQGRRLPAW